MQDHMALCRVLVVFQCSYYIQLQQQFYGLFLARNFSGRYFCKNCLTFDDILECNGRRCVMSCLRLTGLLSV